MLVAYARVVVDEPETVRTRILARARESLRRGDVLAFEPRRTGLRRFLVPAVAGVALVASAAAAYQMLMGPKPTPPGHRGVVRIVELPSSPPALPESTLALAPTASPPATADKPTPAVLDPQPSVAAHRLNYSGREGEELRLLDRARQFDTRGDYPSVLVVAAEHERLFPAGRLAEEREVLHAKALVGLGRANEARNVVAKFRRQFPHSVLLHKIEDMASTLR
jgi:hypothetical protein